MAASARTRLRNKLLRIGGVDVDFIKDPFLRVIADAGVAFANAEVRTTRGRPNECHRNAALFWLKGKCPAIQAGGISEFECGPWRLPCSRRTNLAWRKFCGSSRGIRRSSTRSSTKPANSWHLHSEFRGSVGGAAKGPRSWSSFRVFSESSPLPPSPGSGSTPGRTNAVGAGIG